MARLQPPLGSLRFAAPLPYDQKFNGTLDGTKAAPSCIQFGSAFIEPEPRSEDCLYLDVWVPQNASTQCLPVKVWVYGGSFTGGGVSDPLYDGCNAATDSIVVSVNYRLGPLGFLGLKSVGLTGNYAVQDVLLGLQWVQDNIRDFGGDPNQVLLFGQSAGAALSFLISTLPEASSLISAVAAESGGGRGTAPYVEAQPYFETFVKNLGCDDLDCLRSKSPQELNASFPDSSSTEITLAYPKGFAPVIDGDVVPEDPAKVGTRVPAIFGSTKADGSLFVLSAFKDTFPPSQDNYTTLVEENFGRYASTVKSAYPISKFANISSPSLAPFFAMTAIWTHSSYTCSAQRGLKKATAKGIPAFAYLWDVSPSCPWTAQFGSGDAATVGRTLKLLGATHTSEIPYVFGNTDHLPQPNGTCSFTVVEKNISAAVSSAWDAMARAQDPNSPLLPDTWPSFSTNDTKGLVVSSADGAVIEDIDYSFCKLWDAINEAILANSTEGVHSSY
ncbi:hypothetical protein N0V90_013121 [Kalmusia sp. IMI 367209]|nr:hypothetical protein N0V90_013121 [Kalmusia sp. IMI 367209]